MVEKRIFVARQRQLDRLSDFLSKALNGSGQVCFITGEAGSGKTSLVAEFIRSAQDRRKELIVTYGQSDAQTGLGDAYLPFREIMGQLTGNVESNLVQSVMTPEGASRLRDLLKFSARAIIEVGPDLIGIFVPAAGLLTRIGTFLANETGIIKKVSEASEKRAFPEFSGIDQGHIFEQYTNVVIEVARQRPLVLVLDDLQWADSASISLLFRLGRRIEESRILIIGSYRPEEIALPRAGERHPLEKVLAEFKRYYGETVIDLDNIPENERAGFIGAYLATEPNRLSDDFCMALYGHTGGHPLFTIELLRDLQDRGDLVKDSDGLWIESPHLDWSVLPARVEGVIDERIGRLEDELREILTVASAEGEDFTAEVIASIQSINTRQLVHRLSGELEKIHHLVKAQGLRTLDAQRLSLYRFQHNLFQRYLYDRLDEAERAYLHADVGNVLEELYGEQVDEIAVQLARHFSIAGEMEKARLYLRNAGESAALRYANDEALMYFNRALKLIPEDQKLERLELLKDRERLFHLQGERASQRADLDEMSALSEDLDKQTRAYVLFREAKFNESIGEYLTGIEKIERAISLAQEAGDLPMQALGHQLLGILLCRRFSHEAAQTNLNRALQLSIELRDRQLEGSVLNNFGFEYDNLGDNAKAKDSYRRSLEIARELGDRMLEARTLNNLGQLTRGGGDPTAARRYYEDAMAILRTIGYRKGVGVVLQNLGILYAEQGDYEKTHESFSHALKISREVDDKDSEGRLLGNLGAASAEQGDLESARSYFEQSVEVSKEIGNRHGEAISLDNLAAVYIDRGEFSRAKAILEQALGISREIEDPHLESLIMASLGKYYSDCGEYSRGIALAEEALELKRQTGQRASEGDSFNHLGLMFDQIGQFDRAMKNLEQALSLFRETGDRTGESLCLSFLGLLFHHRDHQDKGREYCLQAEDIARAIGNRSYLSLAFTVMGLILEAMGKLPEAESAYRRSLAIRRELHQEHLLVEPQAGLARVFLAKGNLSRAMSQTEELLESLAKVAPNGTLEPMRIYLTCFQVLRACNDPRALDVLDTTVQILKERAGNLTDESWRRSYLDEILAHREIALANA